MKSYELSEAEDLLLGLKDTIERDEYEFGTQDSAYWKKRYLT